MQHVDGFKYKKKSGPKVLWIGTEGVLKTFEQKDYRPTESITKVLVE